MGIESLGTPETSQFEKPPLSSGSPRQCLRFALERSAAPDFDSVQEELVVGILEDSLDIEDREDGVIKFSCQELYCSVRAICVITEKGITLPAQPALDKCIEL